MAAACAVALIAIGFAGAPRIDGLAVMGARHLTAAQVSAAAGLAGQPVFSANAADARAAVLRLPALLDARVRIALPATARIEVTEREAIARWSVGPLEWYIDAEGVLFGSADPQGAPAGPADAASIRRCSRPRCGSRASHRVSCGPTR